MAAEHVQGEGGLEPAGPVDELFRGGRPIEEALEKLRLRLLDLTARNRLLNFKHTAAKTLQFADSQPGAVYDKLVESADKRVSLVPVPEPKRTDWIQRQGRLARPDVRDYARTLGINISYELPRSQANERAQSNLQTLLYPDELERHCRKLSHGAKTAIEETGANMLFLLLGFLEYPEAPEAEKSLLAPLVPIPVALAKGELERATGTYRYYLVYTGEELAENLSLREKLKADFNLELPVFTEESSLEAYYMDLERAIEGKPGFRLRRQATVALVSMTKMLLVRDLDPKNWPRGAQGSVLSEHKIVRMVFEGRQHDGNEADGEEYDVDRHKHAELPLIYDADSSQHSALIDVVEGKNLVVEGPPGTGKSQTITNLIASAIATGKKVLFVAEKLAALQVVKSRLTQAGLADFCLELHSNKTSKKDVLEAIGTRADRRYTAPSGLAERLTALQEKKKALSAYVELINSHAGNAQGLTMHEVLWKAERFRQAAGEAWRVAQKINFDRATELTRAEFDSLYAELLGLVKEHERIGVYGPGAAFWGFFPETLAPAGELEIERAISDALPVAETLKQAYIATAEVLGKAELGLSREKAATLAATLAELNSLAPDGMAEEMLPRLFTDRDPRGLVSESVIKRLSEAQTRSRDLKTRYKDRLLSGLSVDAPTREQGEKLLTNLKNLGLSEYSTEKLDELSRNCLELVAEARGALEEIRALASMSGLEFSATDQCVLQVALPIELALSCPREHLHRRTPELAAPGTAAIIREARQRFQAIARRQAQLGDVFYLDMSIAEAELEQAVHILREGDEWWRIFQSRHRLAAAFHKRCAKDKKAPKSQRREELEALLSHLKETRLARGEARYRRAMGAQFNADTTDFDALYAVAAWVESANARILEAELEGESFSAMEVTATQVVTLSRSGERLAKAKESLDRCKRLFVEGSLKDSLATRKAFINAKSWPERLTLLSNLAQRLTFLAGTLRGWAPPSQVAEHTIQALRDCDDFRQLLEAADSDNEATALLSERDRGVETDLTPILQAHAYGRAVLDLGLIKEVERVLLSETGNARRKTFLSKLADFERAWVPVEAFCDFLGTRGRFELVAWAGAEPSHSSFVDGFLTRMRKVKASIAGLLHWVQYLQAARFARERGLGDFVDLLETDAMSRGQLPPSFGYRFYGSIAEGLFAKKPALGRFSRLSHETVRKEFARLDREIISLRGRELASASAKLAKPPAGRSGARVAEKTERALLDYLMPQARPRVAIRQMMRAAGRAIQEYMPCFMMGPQAVAQYLAPGAIRFDIVVMDEASQLKPEQALGAIARGNQLIVVGDPKQLPPTTFFDKLGETQEEDEAKVQAVLTLESILDVCMGHFHPVRTLKWHYRSQHESLIAFSNSRYYRNKLIIFPSPYSRSRNLGVRLRYINGATYENQMNMMEANAVVDAVLDHMRSRPADSLGVATLNLKQRELIEELLDKKMRSLDYAEEFCQKWERDGWGFFVKNLENVQGDERDVIFISTTFGPAPGTRAVYQRFGPISRHDGWRRLNVLFTRARKALTVFTSMRPEDIVDGESVPRGTRELRAYLEYARTGILSQVEGGQGQPESDFEIAVMDALARHGYECTPQLGVAGFRIDLAVRHPKHPSAYLAAIECDGAAYHSGRSARDRDRIRQEILEALGWRGRIYRIWSTDWYRGPANELARLNAWLEHLKEQPMDEAYLAPPEPVVMPALTPIQVAPVAELAGTQLTLESLGVTIEEEDELPEVQEGDRVTYMTLFDSREMSVTIGTRTDVTRGLIAYTTPLAEALLGLQQGEEGTLRQPGRPEVRFRIVRIERSLETEKSPL